MSASKQKRVRSDLRADGLDRKSEDQLKAEASNRRFKRNVIITVIVIALVFAAAVVINSNLFFTKMAAVKVGGTGYTAAEFNFYFRNAYNSFVNQYGEGLISTDTPLDEQDSFFGGTWADYLTEQAEGQLQQITAMYDQAVANGYTISQEGLDSIETNLSYYELYAAQQGTTLDGYLAASYGKGMTADLYRQYMTRYITATEYSQTVYEGYSYDADTLSAKYAELAGDYDVVSFHSYFISTSDDAYADMDDEAKAAAAHDAAQAIAGSADADEFGEKVYEQLSDEDKADYESGDTLVNMAGVNIASYYPDASEWLADAARAEGDTTVVDTDSGSYALMFIARDDNQYDLVNVRHILIQAETDDNGEYTPEALEAAHKRIEEIEAEWKANPTEENFAELANQYSEDGGSNTNGGLYENVAKYQMVSEFNDFCFAGHQPGDTGIVHGESANYNGYHLIYFVGEGEVYADYIAGNTLRNEDFNSYVLGISESYEVSEGFAFHFTNRK
ncbi:MAG: peptidylprolyl isomerase [Butyricicoccus sp.]|nr:peptidylprolyl isomerase [Butyricicoccus sp.]